MYAQAHIGGNDKGAQIQRCTIGVGHPVLIHFHQSLAGLHKILYGDLGHAQTIAGVLHTSAVAFGAEQLDLVVGRAVSLQAFKNFLCIVEHHAGGVQRKIGIGHHAGIMPAVLAVIIHQKHMVAELFAKAQLGFIGRLCLGGSGSGDFNIQHTNFLFSFYLLSTASAKTV